MRHSTGLSPSQLRMLRLRQRNDALRAEISLHWKPMVNLLFAVLGEKYKLVPIKRKKRWSRGSRRARK